MKKTAAYGRIPLDLCRPPEGAMQFSPLIMDSENLETQESGSLDAFYGLAPPGTLERKFILAHALRALKAGGELLVMAPKDKGGQRLKKELEEMGCEVEEDSKRHHKICQVRRSGAALLLDENISAGAQRYDSALGLWTQPGVFSWDRIDSGSALLRENLPTLTGHGLDLGAGLGVLSLAALKNNVQITLMELDRRAHLASLKNLEGKNAKAIRADLRHVELKAEYDFVLMNPPFHEAGSEDQSLGQKFIERAAQALKPGKIAHMVVNAHLPYQETLEKFFSSHSIKVANNVFKVIEAKK